MLIAKLHPRLSRKAADTVPDQLDAEYQIEDRHDSRVVPGHPVLHAVEQLSRAVAEREVENDWCADADGRDQDEDHLDDDLLADRDPGLPDRGGAGYRANVMVGTFGHIGNSRSS